MSDTNDWIMLRKSDIEALHKSLVVDYSAQAMDNRDEIYGFNAGLEIFARKLLDSASSVADDVIKDAERWR